MKRLTAVVLATSLPGVGICNTDSDLWDLSLAELMNVQITRVATGSPTPLNRAAAIVTVITAEDLRQTGARNIEDALMSVPGLYVGRSEPGYAPTYIFRGIYGSLNPQALLMINGFPQKSLPIGNKGNVWGGMPVESVQRIEIIRGPGSALYGADAFAGVINVITKTAEDVDGTKLGVRAGSFDTYDAWAQYGGQVAEWSVMFSLEAGSTGGHREIIESDAQTQFDEDFSSIPGYQPISYAPGPINAGYDHVDLRVDLQRDAWQIRFGYQNRNNLETGDGLAGALDPIGSTYRADIANFDLTYAKELWDGELSLVTQLSAYFASQEPVETNYLFPAGAFVGSFPDGYIGNPGHKEIQTTLQQFAVYSGWDSHRLRLGIGATYGDVYETTEEKNFEVDLITPKPEGLVDVSDTDEVWLPEKDRTLYFLSLQDEWQLDPNWQLVLGARYDHYSDFGDTVNPRLALVWATTPDWTTRLLYGRAFRAPSLSELYTISNPVALGNPDLDPEVIDTYELAFNHQLENGQSYGFNFFYYKIKDMILYDTSGNGVAANVGERTGKGVELELIQPLTDQLRLNANYSYQESVNTRLDDDVGYAPNNQSYAQLNWNVHSDWHANVEMHWFGRIQRASQDDRPPVKSASVWNLTIRRANLWGGVELALNLRNLFDKDWRSPSWTRVEYDYPNPGRNGNVTLRYSF
ncbi:MAG: TonB-dependent receptor [Ketobacter sp.]|nr:MAG: TonB-dependent receptor [Ketobacter sp.]